MTRRIAAAFIGLVVAVLAVAVVPLGLVTAHDDRAAFVQDLLSQTQTTARIAEESLSDHASDASLTATLVRLRGQGEAVAVIDRTGRLVARGGPRIPEAVTQQAARVQHPTVIGSAGSANLTAVVPVSDGSDQSGVVVQVRPTMALTARLDRLRLMLAAVAVAAVIAAFIMSAWLSRWVGVPLHRLEQVTSRIGAGDLDAPVGVVHGPREVRHLAASFDAMATRLRVLLEDNRNVIADVSHQLRTPIAALRLRLEALAQHSSTNRPELAEALEEVGRLSRMADGLLAAARAEAFPTPPAILDLATAVSERALVWQPLADEHHVTLTAGTVGTVRVLSVPDHVQQILDNLIANSLETDPLPSRVTITVASRGQTATMTVVDDGPGMTVEQRAHAFDRFHSDRHGRRAGLGLTIVQRLVTTNGGTVGLTPTPGGGLTVIVTLPVAANQPHRPAPRDTPAGRKMGSAARRGDI